MVTPRQFTLARKRFGVSLNVDPTIVADHYQQHGGPVHEGVAVAAAVRIQCAGGAATAPAQ